jgi:hypothetical protein
VAIVTARHVSYSDTLEITTLPGEDPEEELAKYIQEVEGQGHDLKETERPPYLQTTTMRHDRTITCKGCQHDMRVYFIGETLHIFSDFAGYQCTRRQMNVLSLIRRE